MAAAPCSVSIWHSIRLRRSTLAMRFFYGKGREGHHDIQALRAYARQAKNKQLEIDACEFAFAPSGASAR